MRESRIKKNCRIFFFPFLPSSLRFRNRFLHPGDFSEIFLLFFSRVNLLKIMRHCISAENWKNQPYQSPRSGRKNAVGSSRLTIKILPLYGDLIYHITKSVIYALLKREAREKFDAVNGWSMVDQWLIKLNPVAVVFVYCSSDGNDPYLIKNLFAIYDLRFFFYFWM